MSLFLLFASGLFSLHSLFEGILAFSFTWLFTLRIVEVGMMLTLLFILVLVSFLMGSFDLLFDRLLGLDLFALHC